MEKRRREEAKRSGALHADDGGGGDATPVVFLHSTAGNADQWSAQLGHLRSRRRAVALEWRGHGRTGVPTDGDYGIATAAREVFGAVEGLGLGRFVLVGHSGGALVALQCAADHPERVEGLLLVDPAGDLGRVPAEMTEPFFSGIQSEGYPAAVEEYWRSMLTGSEPSVRERVMADLRETSKESVVGFFLAQRQYDPIPVLKRYRGPVLAVTTPVNDAPFSLHNLYPELSHVRFEGTGHWLHMDKPEEFNRLLDHFIAEIEKDARG